jgi:gamma-glutamyl-gamma-aminobutyrate hydrolase PuuD
LTRRPLRIGVSACLFHADPTRPVFNGKPLYYLERSMARWVASEREPSFRSLVYMLPDPRDHGAATAMDVADDLDGLVLQGGVDVSPRTYGEEPRRPEWSGDALRDEYELALVRAMVDAGKPVLGICRGHQLLNVAFGGSLHQDIKDEVEGARVHRDAGVYDRLAHEMRVRARQLARLALPRHRRRAREHHPPPGREAGSAAGVKVVEGLLHGGRHRRGDRSWEGTSLRDGRAVAPRVHGPQREAPRRPRRSSLDFVAACLRAQGHRPGSPRPGREGCLTPALPVFSSPPPHCLPIFFDLRSSAVPLPDSAP